MKRLRIAVAALICGISGLISVTRALTLTGGMIIFASSAWAESWRSYHNARFGTTADVPAGWRMEPPPANNGGRIFTSPDGRAELVVAAACSPGSPTKTNSARGLSRWKARQSPTSSARETGSSFRARKARVELAQASLFTPVNDDILYLAA